MIRRVPVTVDEQSLETLAAEARRRGTSLAALLSKAVDEKGGKIFCLVEAPDAETAHRVHREAHGLVADEIHEVKQGD